MWKTARPILVGLAPLAALAACAGNPATRAPVPVDEPAAPTGTAAAASMLVELPDNPTTFYKDPDLPVAERVEDLLARMTLEEKIGQMTLIEKGSIKPDDIGIQSGGWTIEWQGKTGDITPGTTILEAVQNTVSAQTAVIYDKNANFDDDPPAGEPIVCVGVVGETPYAEGPGDSATLTLPANELQTLSHLVDICDQLAVVLVSGRPLIIADHIDDWDALVASWLPGTEGQGVADVLFGDKPFTGKMSYTWPISVDQLPFDFANSSDEDVLFPFGYRLETP